jgi:hypothetical protein
MFQLIIFLTYLSSGEQVVFDSFPIHNIETCLIIKQSYPRQYGVGENQVEFTASCLPATILAER